MSVPNPIIPSEPMRNAVTKTSTPFGHEYGEGPKLSAMMKALDAAPAPEPQPEVAAEPVAWIDPETFARLHERQRWTTVILNSKRGEQTTMPLYATPPVVEEAVKAAYEACAQIADQYVWDEHALEQATAIGRAVHHQSLEIAEAIRARSATP